MHTFTRNHMPCRPKMSLFMFPFSSHSKMNYMNHLKKIAFLIQNNRLTKSQVYGVHFTLSSHTTKRCHASD